MRIEASAGTLNENALFSFSIFGSLLVALKDSFALAEIGYDVPLLTKESLSFWFFDFVFERESAGSFGEFEITVLGLYFSLGWAGFEKFEEEEEPALGIGS